MKKQYLHNSFSYNPSVLGADRLWNDVKDFLVGKDIIYDSDFDGV